MSDDGRLRIIGLDIKNYRKVKAFSARFDQDESVIRIGGENANGKTSVIDALYNAIVRPQRTVTNPVHQGEDECVIRALVGRNADEVEYRVIRKYSAGGGTRLDVYGKDGAIFSKGTEVLKDLIVDVAVDPVQFMQMDPRDQRNLLAKLIGLDLAPFDSEIERCKEQVKQLESHQQRLQAQAEAMPWFDDAPSQEVSAADLSQQLQEAAAHNSQRAQLQASASACESAVNTALALVTNHEQAAGRIEAEIRRLQDDLKRTQDQLTQARLGVAGAEKARDDANRDLATFQPVDTTAISAQFAQVEDTNRKVRANAARLAAAEQWKQAEQELGEASESKKIAELKKKQALASANFPVDGLEFDSSQVLFNGQPFSQASHAEQIRVALSIGLSMKGKLAPIFIRDASTLDAASMTAIEEIAKEHGAQVFAEIVANKTEDGGWDEDCAFYIVDGELEQLESDQKELALQ